MKLYVKEKAFSIHNKIYIRDENNQNIYEIVSEISSIDKTTIRDAYGRKIVYVEQELFHLSPNYNVYINDNLAFKIQKSLNPFECDYQLSNGYKVDGNFRMLNFTIYDDKNNIIGKIKRTTKMITIGGSEEYEIDILDTNQKLVILSILVAITNFINNDRD